MDNIALKSVLAKILEEIRDLSECQSVGIRLHINGDYPYYVHEGFPNFFILKENTLSIKDEDGQDILDEHGNLILDCMCGKVISNDFNPNHSWFTENGSFWTNSTTKLLESNIDNDDLGKPRNMCHHSGYESVALIPLRAKGKNLGLIQFNDPRKNLFTPKQINNYEHLGDQITVVILNALEIQEKMDEFSNSIKHLKTC
jgi:GAF domain-containing protein